MKTSFLFRKNYTLRKIYLNMLDNREQDCSLIMMLLGYTFRYPHDGPLFGSSGFVYRKTYT
jgi:hypothetical protein